MRSINVQQSKWLFCLGVSFCAVLMTYWPDGLLLFRYDRSAILSGQVWRMITGHLVHLNTPHLVLNVIGLFLLSELLWNKFPVLHALGLLAATSAGISILLWLLHPELMNYAGLSGVLHGLWAAAALVGLSSNLPRRPMSTADPSTVKFLPNQYASLAGLLLLGAKLMLEWRHGASVRTEQLIGAPIVTSAHLYGALIGTAYVLIWRISVLLNRQDDV
ncbi:MAG TPA: rhombosortase [Burkholderiaceae bacterium]|jgi:rhomboid family GlyGly-CTERM serine protease